MSRARATPIAPPAPRPPARDLAGPLLLLTLRRNSLAAWPARAYREMVVHRRFLGTDCFLLNDPDAARHVLADTSGRYVRPISAQRLLRAGVGNGLLAAEGAEWRSQRRMLSPGFTPRHVDSLIPAFTAAFDGLLGELTGRHRVQLGDALERATIDAAGRSLFGLILGERGDHVGALLHSYFCGSAKAQIFDFLARQEGDFAWASRRRTAFSRAWFAMVDGLIAERRSLPPAIDLFSVLTASHDANGGAPLSDAMLRDQLATMLAAGFEPTALAAFWTLFLLANAPAEQALIRAELRATPPDAVHSAADFAAWPRLRAALLEALRLYPPTSVVSRVPLTPDVVANTRIPAGALVMISSWVMQRHEALWSAPDQFQPERFFGQSLPAAFARPGFLPFGAGPRICLGASFAMTQATLLLAHVLARFQVALEPGQRVMPQAIVTTRPDRQPWFVPREAVG